MAAPSTAQVIIKDLLLIKSTDTSEDANIDRLWDEEKDRLTRDTDLFTEVQKIAAVRDQSIYQASSGTVRIMSVYNDRIALNLIDAETLALNDPEWVKASMGTPRLWTHNAIPPDLDSPAPTITPRHFAITPPPTAAASGDAGLTLVTTTVPTTVPSWVETYLTYRVVSRFADESVELGQQEKALFFKDLADIWLEVIRERLQV